MKRIIMLLLVGTLMAQGALYAGDQDTALLRTVFLNQDPDPAEPGEYVELRWKVTKFGTAEIENLTFMLDTDYPFFFDAVDKPEKNVGHWRGYSDDEEHYTLYYKVRVAEDALEGTYPVDLKSRKSEDSGWSLMEYDIRVGEKEEPDLMLGAVRTTPKQLKRDLEEAELSLDLVNIGDSDANNVKMSLQLPEGISPSYTSSHEAVLGTVAAGTTGQGKFYLDLDEDLSSGVYPVDVKVSYKDEDYQEIVLPLNLTLKPSPYFEITDVRMDPATVRPNNKVDIYITVANTGTDDAESVSLHAFKDSSQPFEFDQKSDFVGSLEGGESGVAVLTLDIEDAKPKEYKVDLEVRAIDSNEVITQERQLSFEVANGVDEKQSPVVGIAIIALIVILGIGIYLLRGRFFTR